MLLSEAYNFMFLELGCSRYSELSAMAPEGCLAVRITEEEDLTSGDTIRTLHNICKLCSTLGMEYHIWVSIPCAAGSPFNNFQPPGGRQLGDITLTHRMSDAALPPCLHADRSHNAVSWDWPPGNRLWGVERVARFMGMRGVAECIVSTVAAGMSFEISVGGSSSRPTSPRSGWSRPLTRASRRSCCSSGSFRSTFPEIASLNVADRLQKPVRFTHNKCAKQFGRLSCPHESHLRRA